MIKEERFAELMETTAAIFQRELTQILLDGYWKIMNYYSEAEIEVAFAQALRCCQFFPKPVELIGFITSSRPRWVVIPQEEAI